MAGATARGRGGPAGREPRQEPGSKPSSTARRIVLGTRLRRRREEAGITRAAAGYQIRASESKISRMELGRVSFKPRDVEDLLTFYGVSDSELRDTYVQMARESKDAGWWNSYTDLIPDWFHDYVGLEEAAARIQTYELQFVPGLLQTAEYATAIASHGRPELAGDEVRGRVELRIQRQDVLIGADAPRLWAVLDESVLHRPVGGPDVLRRQIEHLLDRTTQPNITVQLLPYSLSGYAAEGAFTLLRFIEPELPDIVYLEHLTGAYYLDKRDEIERYSRVVDQLTVDAATPDETRQLLAKRRAEL